MKRLPDLLARAAGMKFDLLFWLGLVLILGFRLLSWWGLQVPRTNEGLDDLLYMRLAQGWYWGYEYDYLGFVRRPGFPLWIAFWDFLSISFGSVQKIAYVGAFSLLAVAAKRLGLPPVLILGALILSIFHPYVAGVVLRITPDGFYTIVSILGLSFSGLWLSSRTSFSRRTFALLLGGTLGVLVLTRDEQIVAFGWMAVLGAVFIGLRFCPKTRYSLSYSLLPFTGAYALMVVPVLVLNYIHFGVFAISEFSSGGFSSAYRAGLSVPQEKAVRGVPITQQGFELLFEHCPSWALLSDSIRRDSKVWSKLTEHYTRDSEEVGAGAFPWMIKSAVSRAGFYKDAQTADAFFSKLGSEVRIAQSEGVIGKRGPVISQLDPDWRARLPDVWASFRKLSLQIAYPDGLVIPYAKGHGQDFQELTSFFHEVLGRSKEEPEFFLDSAVLKGWAFKTNDELLSMEIIDHEDEVLYRFGPFHPREDVHRIHASANAQMNSGFRGEFAFDSLDTRMVKVVFHSKNDVAAEISLGQFLASKNGWISKGLNSQIVYYLDVLETEGQGGGRLVPSSDASRHYMWGFVSFSVLVLVVTFFRKTEKRFNPMAIVWCFLILTWFLGRFAMNVIVDATAFPCVPRNAFSGWIVVPILIVSLSALVPGRGLLCEHLD